MKVDFPRPEYHEEFRHVYYGAPVLYSQTHYSIFFDKSYLDHEIVQNEASVESYVRRNPLDLFLPLDAGGTITQLTRRILRDLFADSFSAPTLNQVAEAMECSVQTLRRWLKSEGSSYHVVKAQVRRDIAIHHLGHPETSIESIAGLTGYSEPSAFIRAFKEWTGFTPLQFRKGMEK